MARGFLQPFLQILKLGFPEIQLFLKVESLRETVKDH